MRESGLPEPKENSNQLGWIPDFGQPIVILRALLVAVLIAILLAVLRAGLSALDSGVFGSLVFLSVWICCLSAIGLQLLRKAGSNLPIWAGASLAIAWMVISAGICGIAPFLLGLPTALRSQSAPFDMAVEAMLITLIVGSVVLRVLYAHYELQEQQKRLLDAKYDALQARIRPHFLFNSLNSVAELIAIGSERAENAILDLSDLFRATLSDQGPVPISQELLLCEKYLNVEKLRMGERLTWDFDVDEEARIWLIPALSLQPLLENAVLHGIQPLPEGGHIEMNLKVVGNELNLRIKNPLSTRKEPSSRGTGTALKNVQARLNTFYKGAVAFSAEDRDGCYLVSMIIQRSS